MISVRDPKILTSIVMAVLAATTIPLAYNCLMFAVSKMMFTKDSGDEQMRSFVDKTGVAEMARSEIARLALPTTLKGRTDDVVGILTGAPLRSFAWLDFAFYRNAADSAHDVAAALALSTLTGPNEGSLMPARALFALPLWTKMPPNIRRNMISDLLNSWDLLTDDSRRAFANALSGETADTRAEIRAALLLAGRNGDVVAQACGLADPASEIRPAAEEKHPRTQTLPSLLSGAVPLQASPWPGLTERDEGRK
jgi:hypothetical protein